MRRSLWTVVAVLGLQEVIPRGHAGRHELWATESGKNFAPVGVGEPYENSSMFARCGGPVVSYGAAWLAKTALAKKVQFPKAWRRLEQASFSMYHATVKAGGGPLQFKDPRAFFSLHLSGWLRKLQEVYPRLTAGATVAKFAVHARAKLDDAMRLECADVAARRPNASIVALIPFHAPSCRGNCSSPWKRETGNSHALEDEAVRYSALKITICSVWRWVPVVCVFVMPAHEAALNAVLDDWLVPIGLRGRVRVVVNRADFCDSPRMLPICALDTLHDRRHVDFYAPFDFVYYTEADIVARWASPDALQLALDVMRSTKNSRSSSYVSYFPPVRTISLNCSQPTNDQRVLVENACDVNAAHQVWDRHHSMKCTAPQAVGAAHRYNNASSWHHHRQLLLLNTATTHTTTRREERR